MSLQIGWFSFEGPFPSLHDLHPKPGVFAILSLEEGGQYNMLDVDEAANVVHAIEEHERRACWQEHTGKDLHYAIYYTPDVDLDARTKIVKEIRMEYVMACSPAEKPTHGFWDPDVQ